MKIIINPNISVTLGKLFCHVTDDQKQVTTWSVLMKRSQLTKPLITRELPVLFFCFQALCCPPIYPWHGLRHLPQAVLRLHATLWQPYQNVQYVTKALWFTYKSVWQSVWTTCKLLRTTIKTLRTRLQTPRSEVTWPAGETMWTAGYVARLQWLRPLRDENQGIIQSWG